MKHLKIFANPKAEIELTKAVALRWALMNKIEQSATVAEQMADEMIPLRLQKKIKALFMHYSVKAFVKTVGLGSSSKTANEKVVQDYFDKHGEDFMQKIIAEVETVIGRKEFVRIMTVMHQDMIENELTRIADAQAPPIRSAITRRLRHVLAAARP